MKLGGGNSFHRHCFTATTIQTLRTSRFGKLAFIRNRCLLKLEGEDAVPFLQGMMTQNITRWWHAPPTLPANSTHENTDSSQQMKPYNLTSPNEKISPPTESPSHTSALFSLLLSPKGRVLYDVMMSRVGDVLVVECDELIKVELVAHLLRYRLRSKVSVDSESWKDKLVFHLWHHTFMSNASVDRVQFSLHQAGYKLLQDPRASQMGCRIYQCGGGCHCFSHLWLCVDEGSGSGTSTENGGSERDIFSCLPDVKLVPDSEYHKHRYTLGIPESSGDFTPGVMLPLESNVDWMNGVDFQKGCYVGQELTIRTHHTGVVRKRLVSIQLDYRGNPSIIDVAQKIPRFSEIQVDPSDGTPTSKSAPSKSVGKFIRGVDGVGLALMRLDFIDRQDLHLIIGDGERVHLRATLPLLPTDPEP